MTGNGVTIPNELQHSLALDKRIHPCQEVGDESGFKHEEPYSDLVLGDGMQCKKILRSTLNAQPYFKEHVYKYSTDQALAPHLLPCSLHPPTLFLPPS